MTGSREGHEALEKETASGGAAEIRRLGAGDERRFLGMLDLFATVFDEPGTYGAKRPGPEYTARLLANPAFVGLVALDGERIVGALAAYELPKFEQERSEFYIYDLAVAEGYRRRGIATSLIAETRAIAKRCGGWVVIVQADRGDDPAITLYSGLGTCEEVLHFDIRVE